MPITSTPNVPVETYNTQQHKGIKPKTKWWEQPDEEMHTHVWATIKNIRKHQEYRSTNNLKFARLYSNMEITSLSGGLFNRTNDAQNFTANRVTYNVIKSCIDTASSKISRSKPRPFFLTEGASWDLQQRAKMLTKFFQGLYENMGTGTGEDRTFWGIGRQCFVDACIFGTGPVHIFTEGNEVKAERNFVDEILVDDAEGRYRNPRQMHRIKLVFREVLFDLFPAKYHNAIAAAPSGLQGDIEARSTADMIQVAESWHLPSGENAKDGRYCMSIENCTLSVSEYNKSYFPFLFQRWSLHPLGFYGRGLAEELIGIQLEINKTLRNIQLAQHLVAVPQVWLDVSSKIPGKKINNEIGGIKYYRGTAPQFYTPQAMSGEIYNHLETLYRKAYEITGISLMSATSQKPSGLDSGRAIREYKDIQTERFALTENMYEDFYMEATYMALDMLRDLTAEGKKPIVRVKDGAFSEEISFKDVDIPNDKVAIRAYPTNFLPSTPAGKFQTVQELVQAGFYSQEEALDLLDFPDLAKANKIKLGPRDAVIKVIEYNVKNAGKDYISPDPRMNLEFAKPTAQTYLMRGLADNMPEDKLDVIRKFQDQIEGLLEQAKQEVAPQVTAEQPLSGQDMTALAQPEAPPVSDLLPQG